MPRAVPAWLAAAAALAVAVSGCAGAGGGVTGTGVAASGSTESGSRRTASGASTAGPMGAIAWDPPVRLDGRFSVWKDQVAVVRDVMVALQMSSTEEPARTVVRTSSDGLGWQVATTLEGVRLWAVAPAANQFVAVGSRDADDGRGVPVVATSPDGRGWQVIELERGVAGVAYDVADTPAGLVVVGSTSRGSDAPHPTTWSSSDGVMWTAGFPQGFGEFVGSLRFVATAGSAVVAVGHRDQDHGLGDQLAWWSDDGLHWHPSTSPTDWGAVLVGDMASGSVGAVLVGAPHDDPSSPQAWLTKDGRTWVGAELPVLPDTGTSFPSDVASDGQRWVAVSDDVGAGAARHPGIWVSDDATSWRRVPMTELDGPALRRLTDARAVVVHDDKWLVYGTTAAQIDPPSGNEWVLWRSR